MSQLSEFGIAEIVKKSFRSGLFLPDKRDLVYESTDIEFQNWIKKLNPGYNQRNSGPMLTPYDRYELIEGLRNEGLIAIDSKEYSAFSKRMEEIALSLLREWNSQDH